MNRLRFVLFGAMALILTSAMMPMAPAHANILPSGCTSNDFVVNLDKSVSVAYDETTPGGPTTVTYSVSAGNPNSDGHGCNVTDVGIVITDPHGTAHTIQTGGSYPIGTAVTTLGTTVSYVVSSTDETGGVLMASVNATGTLHDSQVGNDALNITKGVSLTVIHPNTAVTITPSSTAVAAGSTTTLTVTEKNTGDAPLSGISVTLTPPGTSLTASSSAFTGGDANSNGMLDPGETWSWTVPETVTTTTVYTATGNGTDAIGSHITAPAFPGETASTTIRIVDANIGITPATSTDPVNDHHVLTAHVNVNPGTGFVNAPDGTIVSFAIVSGPGTLSSTTCTTAGGTGSCTDTLTSAVVGTTTVKASADVTASGVTLHRTTDGLGANSTSAIKVWIPRSPSIATTLSSTSVMTGTAVKDSAALSGATPDAGGTVTYTVFTNNACTAGAQAAGTVTVASGTVPDSNPVTFNATGTFYWLAAYSGDAQNAAATSTCGSEVLTVTAPAPQAGPTRTQGFWKTHTAFSLSVLSAHPITLGPRTITTGAELFGGLEANVAKTSTGAKRSALDQARIQLAHQYLAAALNCAAFGCSAATQTLLANASAAYAGTDVSAINAYASQLDAFNSSGDSLAAAGTNGPATPKDSDSLANLSLWDALP